MILFSTYDVDGKKCITFPGTEYSTRSQKKDLEYDDYKEDKLIIQIESDRGRLKNKQFKKIDEIINDAKQIPL